MHNHTSDEFKRQSDEMAELILEAMKNYFEKHGRLPDESTPRATHEEMFPLDVKEQKDREKHQGSKSHGV